MLEAVDLFSGIGGFALAAAANGIETICFVEKDERCRDFLAGAWPGVPIYDDVTTFDGTQWADAYLFTAGVPCQPASRAGKQRGAADDRWLWPDALRVLGQVRPAWCLFENPPGIGDVGLAGLLAGVEAHGYAVRVFGIPACAIGAPHRRMRYWIVGKKLEHTTGIRSMYAREYLCGGQRETTEETTQKGSSAGNRIETEFDGFVAQGLSSGLAHSPRHGNGQVRSQPRPDRKRTRQPMQQGGVADSPGAVLEVGQCQRNNDEPQQPPAERSAPCVVADAERTDARMRDEQGASQGIRWDRSAIDGEGFWSDFVWVPCADHKLRRAPGDSFRLVDGLHRSVLGALGNSIVWPVAAEIIRAMRQADLMSLSI